MQSKNHIKITMHASEIRTHLQIGKGNNSAESNSIQPKKIQLAMRVVISVFRGLHALACKRLLNNALLNDRIIYNVSEWIKKKTQLNKESISLKQKWRESYNCPADHF